MDSAALQFFDKMPDVLPLYEVFLTRLDSVIPEYNIKVKKTQISFSNKYNFAFVSLPVRRIKGCPKDCMIVTFGLSYQVKHPRILVSSEPYPNRWTHHVAIQDQVEIDSQLLDWIKEAYHFSLNK